MAFNPFANFRKYPKIWMATVLLLCMVTFVFCQGAGQGGLDDIFTRWLGQGGGKVLARIDGRAVQAAEIDLLKRKRSLANDFMRKGVEVCLENIKKSVKDNSKPVQDKEQEEERQHYIHQWMGLKVDFDERLKKPRYFEGGTGTQELLEFLLWQKQADRLGINLVDDSVDLEVRKDLAANLTRWNNDTAFAALYRVREQQSWSVTMEDLRAALRDEFRVRIAQLVLMGSHPEFMQEPNMLPYDYPLQYRIALTPDQLWQHYRQNLSQINVALLPIKVEPFTKKVPEPTADQLNRFYKEFKEKPYNPASDTPGFMAPEKLELSYLVFDAKAKHYQQAAELALTFQKTPPVFFDATMPGLGPLFRTLLGPKAWEASMERYYSDLRNRDIGGLFTSWIEGTTPAPLYGMPSPLSPNFVLPLFNSIHDPSPTTVAGLVAGSNLPGLLAPSPCLFQAAAVVKQEKQVAPLIQEEVKKRLPAGLQLLGNGFTGQPLSPVLPLLALGNEEYVPPSAPTSVRSHIIVLANREHHIPLSLVEDKVVDFPRKKLASTWAVENMEVVKKKLEADKGVPAGFKARLRDLLAGLKDDSMKIHKTTGLRNTFDIAADPNLAAFQKQFDRYRSQINMAEGRDRTERELKDDDLPRLFFGKDEGFSLGTSAAYGAVQVWPPTVTLPRGALRRSGEIDPVKELLEMVGEDTEKSAHKEDMWKVSDSPILFWKTNFEAARPVRFDEVRPQVIEAFKLGEARSEALKAAKDLGQELRKKLEDPVVTLEQFLEKEAGKLGEKLVTLHRVAPLIKHQLGTGLGEGSVEYKPYTLPRDLIQYPRPDTVKSLLALKDLSEPLKVVGAKKSDDSELDKANKALFDEARKGKSSQVQLLTNRPRDTYYVAVILKEHPADPKAFDTAFLNSRGLLAAMQIARRRMTGGLPQMPRDTLVTDAQIEAGKAYRQALIAQLRAAHLTDVSTDAEDKE